MKFGVALLCPDVGGAEAGVLEALDVLGVKVGAILGKGFSSLTALFYASGISNAKTAEIVKEASGKKGFYGLLFKSKVKRNAVNELEKMKIKRLSDAKMPIYLLVADKDGAITVITSEKTFISGNYSKKCELSPINATDYIFHNGKYSVKEENFFKRPLIMNDISGIISVSGSERKTGVTDYGYNISIEKRASYRAVVEKTLKESDELLKNIFLR